MPPKFVSMAAPQYFAATVTKVYLTNATKRAHASVVKNFWHVSTTAADWKNESLTPRALEEDAQVPQL